MIGVHGEYAEVDFGGGLVKTVMLTVEGVHEGDYVVVHAGIVVSKLSREDFLEAFSRIREIGEKLVEKGMISEDELDRLVDRKLLNG